MSMINYQKKGPIGIVELDDPAALNALTPEGLVDLRNALAACQDDEGVRVIILTGAGDKAFCAGANLKKTFPPTHSFAKGALSSKEVDAENGGYTRLMDLSDLHIWKPMIAAINGYCLGGGLELAMQCDLRIASSGASFALPEVKVGSVPAVGGVQALIRSIAPRACDEAGTDGRSHRRRNGLLAGLGQRRLYTRSAHRRGSCNRPTHRRKCTARGAERQKASA